MNTKWLKLRNKYAIIALKDEEGKKILKVNYISLARDLTWSDPISWENAISIIKECMWAYIPYKIIAKHYKRRAKFNNRRLIKKYAIYPPGVANKCKK